MKEYGLLFEEHHGTLDQRIAKKKKLLVISNRYRAVANSRKPSFSGRNPIFPKAHFLLAFGTEILPETRFRIKVSKTLFQRAVEGGF
jgi:hypothetical protein